MLGNILAEGVARNGAYNTDGMGEC
jgi:hypothetical protein